MRPLKARAVALAIFVLFLSFFQSCQTKNPLNYETEPLEGKVIFSIMEGYSEPSTVSNPRIMLSMHTEKIYPCINYKLATEIDRSRNEILVFLSHVYIGNICFTAFGPARYEAPLDLTEGTYSVVISNRDYDDRYEIRVSGSSIEIIEKESNFTMVEDTLVWRYPHKSFAYLCGTTTETKWMCQDFLDTLLANIELKEFQFADVGEIPYPTSTYGFYYDTPARYFIYNNEEDFESAIQILKRYALEVIGSRDGIGIWLQNWRNQMYGSWFQE